MKTFQELLKSLNACEEAREWAADMTIEEVVSKCHRGDWLLWLAQRIGVELRPLTLAKALCAKTVLHLMKYERSRNAVEVAERFGRGEATKEELAAAAADAYADDAYAAAAYAAAAAADAYADAAYAAAAYAAAYAAAAYAAAAAAAAYADDAYADDAYADDAYAAAAYARKDNQLQTANICRETIGVLIIEIVKSKLQN